MNDDGRLPSDVIREQLARQVLRSRRMAVALAEAHERVALTEEETAETYETLAARGGPHRQRFRGKAEAARKAAATAHTCAIWAYWIADRAPDL
ncbi:hypothetical protein J5X84_19925 [Streptosporangiaceae bacterium NEAU-GS5]|nr:hypothetical protein [Streptosporangiaceae bacterium NEAU-GS5]